MIQSTRLNRMLLHECHSEGRSKVQLLLLTHCSLSAHVVFTCQFVPEMCCFLQTAVASSLALAIPDSWGSTSMNDRKAFVTMPQRNETRMPQYLLQTDRHQQHGELPHNVNHEELPLAVPQGGQSCQCLKLPRFCPSACVASAVLSV